MITSLRPHTLFALDVVGVHLVGYSSAIDVTVEFGPAAGAADQLSVGIAEDRIVVLAPRQAPES